MTESLVLEEESGEESRDGDLYNGMAFQNEDEERNFLISMQPWREKDGIKWDARHARRLEELEKKNRGVLTGQEKLRLAELTMKINSGTISEEERREYTGLHAKGEAEYKPKPLWP